MTRKNNSSGGGGAELVGDADARTNSRASTANGELCERRGKERGS